MPGFATMSHELRTPLGTPTDSPESSKVASPVLSAGLGQPPQAKSTFSTRSTDNKHTRPSSSQADDILSQIPAKLGFEDLDDGASDDGNCTAPATTGLRHRRDKGARKSASRAHGRKRHSAGRNVLRSLPGVRHVPVRFMLHKVKPGEDITMLAIKYGTSETQIRRYNQRIIFDCLDNVCGDIILVPLTPNPDHKGLFRSQLECEKDVDEGELRLKKVKQFMSHARGLSHELEAYMCLDTHKFDVEAALTSFYYSQEMNDKETRERMFEKQGGTTDKDIAFSETDFEMHVIGR